MPKKSNKQKQKQKQKQTQIVKVNVNVNKQKSTPARRAAPTRAAPNQSPVIMTTPVYNLPPNFNQHTPHKQEALKETNPPRANTLATTPLENEVIANAVPFMESAESKRDSVAKLPILNRNRYSQIIASGYMPRDITNEYNNLTTDEKRRLKDILAKNFDDISKQKVTMVAVEYGEKGLNNNDEDEN